MDAFVLKFKAISNTNYYRLIIRYKYTKFDELTINCRGLKYDFFVHLNDL